MRQFEVYLSSKRTVTVEADRYEETSHHIAPMRDDSKSDGYQSYDRIEFYKGDAKVAAFDHDYVEGWQEV